MGLEKRKGDGQGHRELLRLEGASIGCAGYINSQPTRPSDET
jgi:hypothetical protein